jgi:hypothetical protein
MTNGQSRLLDVLLVKERALERLRSPQRKMLEIVSMASTIARLKQAGLIPPNWNDPGAASAHKKSATPRGGRKRIATERQRFYLIGLAVDQQFRKFEPAFKLLRELKIIGGNFDVNELRSILLRYSLTTKEIETVLQARTPRGAAKRFVAKSLTSHKYPSGISLGTVNSSYSRYLKALQSKRTPASTIP